MSPPSEFASAVTSLRNSSLLLGRDLKVLLELQGPRLAGAIRHQRGQHLFINFFQRQMLQRHSVSAFQPLTLTSPVSSFCIRPRFCSFQRGQLPLKQLDFTCGRIKHRHDLPQFLRRGRDRNAVAQELIQI